MKHLKNLRTLNFENEWEWEQEDDQLFKALGPCYKMNTYKSVLKSSSYIYDTICSIHNKSNIVLKKQIESQETQLNAKNHERSLINYMVNTMNCIEIKRKGDWWYDPRFEFKKNSFHKNIINTVLEEKKLECKNTTNLNDGLYVFHQPRGSQNHPDCLVIHVIGESLKLFAIECKSFTTRIMWNDSYPGDSFYFYYVTNTKSGESVIFPGGIGEGVITKQENDLLIKEQRLVKSIRAQMKLSSIDRPNGWSAYPRYNFTQTGDFTLRPSTTKAKWKKIFCKKFNQFISKKFNVLD